MTSTQFRLAIKHLGLTQEQAGVFMGRSPHQGQRWANGARIPESVSKLLRVMIKLHLKPEQFR